MQFNFLLLLIVNSLFPGQWSYHSHEKPIATFIGDDDVMLKTSDGCGEGSVIIINRGGGTNSFPASIGYFGNYTYPFTYVSADTINDSILDVAYANVFSQQSNSGNDTKYFAVITASKIYLYSEKLSGANSEPEISLADSIETPENYMLSCFSDNYLSNQLLIISQPPDSTSFRYSFYSVPDLTLSGEMNLNIHPEKIVDRSSFPPAYLLSGDSLGYHKLFVISTTTFKITKSFLLPPDADNVQSVIGYGLPDYLLANPGDTAINLVKLNESNSVSTVYKLMHDAGIHVSSSYTTEKFLFQPIVFPSSNDLNNKLIEVNGYSGSIEDTIDLGQKATAIETGYYPGFGGFFDFITGTSQNAAGDWVYYWSYGFDSIQAGSVPSWFIGDVRCYVNVQQIEKNLAIKIFPNPVNENLQVYVSGLAENKNYEFTITDINGKLLWHRELVTKEEYVIPMKEFPSGILILKVDAGSKVVSEKVLKL